MANLKYNSYEFDSAEWNFIEKTGHDENTEKKNDITEVAGSDDSVVVNSNFTPKKIIVTGKLAFDTYEELQDAIDELKLNALAEGGKLIVPIGDAFRTFIVYPSSCTITRDDDYCGDCIYQISYIASNPPFGLDSDSTGALIKTNAHTSEGFGNDLFSQSILFAGTAKPKPKIRIEIATANAMTEIEIINATTGQEIKISDDTIVDGDVFVVDTENLRVSKNGDDIDFSGVFPDFVVGLNDVLINFYSPSETVLQYYQTENVNKKSFYGQIELAQSFTTDDSISNVIPRLALLLQKIGTPGDISLRIETDNSTAPSGTIINDSEITIDKDNVHDLASWIYEIYGFNTKPVLEPETKYWIVVNAPDSDEDNYYNWFCSNKNPYADGEAMRKYNAWVAVPNSDFCFKMYKSILDQSVSDESADAETEAFTSTTNRDASTTGYWGTDGVADLGFRPKTIPSTGLVNEMTAVGAATDGTLYRLVPASGTSQGGGTLYMQKSIDGGIIWTNLAGTVDAYTTLISTMNQYYQSRHFIDTNNDIHIVYITYVSGVFYGRYKKLTYNSGTKTWSVGSETAGNFYSLVGTPANSPGPSLVAVDSSGRIFVAFNYNAGGGSIYDVLAKSTDGGASWSNNGYGGDTAINGMFIRDGKLVVISTYDSGKG
ncbi:MAG TPA: hypothetical protein PLE33_05780 [Candidatus Cloacimonas sp.]|nr:hypothetical protein [Candidatus Cloacimonas sp.]HPS60754.1 hypothetical protein [Candidatus Cloacimonas sp.]